MSATTKSKSQYNQAVRDIAQASRAYYTSDTVTMDDADYDALLREVAAIESIHPDWVTTNTTTAVAAGALDQGDVSHSSSMLSLDNAMDDDELEAWFNRLSKLLAATRFDLVVEPKLDGLAISATYVDGVLVRAATRGDGLSGEDVTARAKTIKGLPAQLANPVSIEVRGEVVMTDSDFDLANQYRVGYGKTSLTSQRSGAAGGLRNQNQSEIVPLSFACYGAYGNPKVEGDYVDAMNFVRSLGVVTARERIGLKESAVDRLADVKAAIDKFAERRDSLDFEIDGAVIKVNTSANRDLAGNSSRAPKWAIAFKYPARERLTTLLEVNWQVGRSGIVTPRARIIPTFVGGVTVEFATMHNVDHLVRNGWMIGDVVGIRRAGDVVPELLAPLLERRATDATPIEIPTACPECGGELDTTGARWRCLRGRACGAVKSIGYAVSRDSLDIEGMGEKLVRQLVESNRVTDVADLFTLTEAELAGLDRMGTTSAANIVTEINVARTQPLARVITSLGIRSTGRSLSRKLAKAFTSLDALRNASIEQLQDVDHIGVEKALLIRADLEELDEVITKLLALGIGTGASATPTTVTAAPLAGKTVVVTGSMTGVLAEKSRNDEVQQVKTLAHELGHALLHEEGNDLPRDHKEIEAESVAYVVSQALGIDSGGYSFGYLTSWGHGDPEAVEKQLKSSGQRIQKASHQIIEQFGKVPSNVPVNV